MANRQFQLTEAQVQELTRAYANCKDGPTRTRYQAVRLYGTGYPTEEVMDITGCARSSLMNWCQAYRVNGIEGLIDKRKGGNRAKLNQVQVDGLRDRLQMYAPADLFGATSATESGQFWTVPDLQRAVEQWYGVSYRHPSSYHRLLNLSGFSYQRPAKVYRSRSATRVAEFEEQLEKNSST
jgi:transposase